MKIQNINFINFPKIKFLPQSNPISFRGEIPCDTFESSYATLLSNEKREELNNQLLDSIKNIEKYRLQITQIESIEIGELSEEECRSIVHLANRHKEFYKFCAALLEIYKKNKASEDETDSETYRLTFPFARRKLGYKKLDTMPKEKTIAAIKEALKDTAHELKKKEFRERIRKSKIEEALGYSRTDGKTKEFDDSSLDTIQKGYFTRLNEKSFDRASEEVMSILRCSLEIIYIDNMTCATASEANEKIIKQIQEASRVVSGAEFADICGSYSPSAIFPLCKQINFENGHTIVTFDKDDELSARIYDDITAQKVISREYLEKTRRCGVQYLPLKYKRYSPLQGEKQKLDYFFVDLEDESNQRVLNNIQQFRTYLRELPFKYINTPFGEIIDMDDEYNQQMLNQAHDLYPHKSRYFCSQMESGKETKVDIPVEYLEKLGFAKASVLTSLVKSKKLDGKITTESGKTRCFVSISNKERLGRNKNLDTLLYLRGENPAIKSFNDFAKALKIPRKRLNQAIFSGDVEIIDEYISVTDKPARYIDITRPKNVEFVRKIQFEQQFEASIKEQERLEHKRIKAENSDLRYRLRGARKALAWHFMPNTKRIGSILAKENGYIAKLLAKESDPNATLTPKEEIAINSYRKELWLQAGTEELHLADKKASELIKRYKEFGLSSLDEECQEILRRYGFQ